MNGTRFRRFARKFLCAAIQIVMVVGTVAMAAYLMSRTDCGKVVTHELVKGLAGGIVGGLVVGMFLAVQKRGVKSKSPRTFVRGLSRIRIFTSSHPATGVAYTR